MSSDIERLDMVRKILQKAITIICDNLNPKPLLLPMQAANALEQNDVTRIEKAGETDSDKAQKLVDTLTKKPASSYDVFMNTLFNKRKDIYNAVAAIEKEVGYIRPEPPASQSAGSSAAAPAVSAEPAAAAPSDTTDTTPPRPDPGAQKVSNPDIFKITQKAGLTSDNMDALYQILDIPEADIDSGEQKSKSKDFRLQGSKILQGWAQKNGKAATRQIILAALDMCDVPEAVEFLRNEWKITS